MVLSMQFDVPEGQGTKQICCIVKPVTKALKCTRGSCQSRCLLYILAREAIVLPANHEHWTRRDANFSKHAPWLITNEFAQESALLRRIILWTVAFAGGL